MLFDSLGHATIDGKWLNSNLDASFKTYSQELEKNGYLGGLVVGIYDQNKYEHESFLNASKDYKNLYPIAGFNPVEHSLNSLSKLKEDGFIGIKIHPRFSNIDLEKDKQILIDCFQKCTEIDLPVLFCSYYHCGLSTIVSYDPYLQLIEILKLCPDTRFIIVHGGGLDLLKFSELARFNENLLIDLSLVLMKFKNSSIDTDIQFLFESFDRKISIGSDFPEYNLHDVRNRFEFFSKEITLEKKENIGFKNIINFLNLNLD